MTTCQNVSAFLEQVAGKNVTTRLSDPDLTVLQQAGLIQVLTAAQVQQVEQNVEQAGAARDAILSEQETEASLQQRLSKDSERVHSVLFHFEGAGKKQAQMEQVQTDQQQLKDLDADLQKKQATFSNLMAQRQVLDALTTYDGTRYVSLTPLGAMNRRDLLVRLYRVSDLDFTAYWREAQKLTGDLNGIADASASIFGQIFRVLPTADRSYLWAVAIGMAKSPANAADLEQTFAQAYAALDKLSTNEENRLMAAEILSCVRGSVDQSVGLLQDLLHDVRKAGVPKESALGVAAILLAGRRADGTFATPNLPGFLSLTQSYEAAAMLTVVNAPVDALAGKFGLLRQMFFQWGYSPSEDVELAAAYLTISDLPVEGIATKIQIISRGLATYLEYPLVASAILGAVPVLEANETLNLVEHAYTILGQRTGPMSQSELACLAVRMVHGVQVQSVSELDPTAPAAAGPLGFAYGAGPPIRFFPIMVFHGYYYSTFSGIGGAHPGHVHTMGGFVG